MSVSPLFQAKAPPSECSEWMSLCFTLSFPPFQHFEAGHWEDTVHLLESLLVFFLLASKSSEVGESKGNRENGQKLFYRASLSSFLCGGGCFCITTECPSTPSKWKSPSKAGSLTRYNHKTFLKLYWGLSTICWGSVSLQSLSTFLTSLSW